MLKNDFKKNEELLLRKQAAIGNFKIVEEILTKNKENEDFNINGCSSNGNTALHWACLKAIENHAGYSEKYNKVICSLIQFGANYLIKNNDGKIPHDFLQDLHVNVKRSETFSQDPKGKDSCYFTLINEQLKIECAKIFTSLEDLDGELASATAFHFIIDSLKLFDFFPSEKKHQDSFTILSLACGLSTEVLPLIMYFQYQNKKVNYIGIDTNSDMINDNQTRYKAYENVEFICADASNLTEITIKVPLGSIDLGIMRNGDFTEHRNRQDTFCKIVDRIFPKLIKPDCPLLITFQTQEELNLCSHKTQILQNFKKIKSNNFCDVGKLCSFYTQYLGTTVITHPDRFSAILNLDKTINQTSLNQDFKKLRM